MTADWKFAGLCTTEGNPDDWFISTRDSSRDSRARVRALLAICDRCPVKDACLTEAIDAKHSYGVWGGMTTEQRERLITKRKPGRQRAREQHGTEAGYAQHRRRGDQACDECMAAANLAAGIRRDKRRAKREAA